MATHLQEHNNNDKTGSLDGQENEQLISRLILVPNHK